MDKFIKLLLESQNTVIIPGLGAIVLDDPETGKLIFNEYLKYNDGKLDAIIVQESNMDLQEAQNYIAKYVREIQTDIDKGESYDIFGLGSIKKDEEGTIHFKGNLNTKDTSTKSKKEEQKATSPSSSVKDKEEDKKVAKKPEPKETTPKKEDKAPVKEAEKKVEPKKPARPADGEAPKEKDTKASGNAKKDKLKEDKKAAAEAEKKKKADKKAADKKLKDDKKKADQKKKKDAKPAAKEGTKKKKIGVFFWIIIILLVIAGAGGTYVGLNYDQVKEYMGWNQFEGAKELAENIQDKNNDEEEGQDEVLNDSEESDKDQSTEDIADTEETDEESTTEKEELLDSEVVEVKETVEIEPETEPEPEPETQAAPVSSKGDYHLIAGTFSEKSNAEGLVSDLKAAGHPAQIIGYLNSMHYVSVKSFDSASAAQKGISSVQNDVPKAWVYKKP